MPTRSDLEFELDDHLVAIKVTVIIVLLSIFLVYEYFDIANNPISVNIFSGIVASSGVLFLVSVFKYLRTQRLIKSL